MTDESLPIMTEPFPVEQVAEKRPKKKASKPPTSRQTRVLQFIVDYTIAHGMPPTLREIGAHMGIRSTNGVNDHIRGLERRGLLTKRDLTTRSLRPTSDGLDLVGVKDGVAPAPLMSPNVIDTQAREIARLREERDGLIQQVSQARLAFETIEQMARDMRFKLR